MMSELLLRTKLSPPLVPQALVPRQRLLNNLDEGLLQPDGFGRRLTLISAPPGYGKTCLTVEWLQERHEHFAWLAIDEEDNDPIRFLVYLLAALQRVDPGIGSETQALLGLPQPPPAEVILTTLINEISAFDSPVILVLDDYHLIQLPSIHDQMAFMVEHQPKCLHLMILSREDPPLPLHRLRARRQMLEIHQDDLRFSPDESLHFFNQVMEVHLGDQIVEALTLRTEGWITGLQLAAISLCYHPDVEKFVDSFSGSNRYVLDYLFEEVFQQQTPEVQSFLLATSILNRLTPSLCDALTGRNDGRLQLQRLEKANLFISPLDAERHWYRYQQLFADLLQHLLRLSAELSEPQLHMRASQWYWRNGHQREAVRHALVTNDWEYASQLIAECADSLLKRGEIATLLNWFTKIPERIIQNNVRIGLTYAWALMLSGQFKTAATILHQVEQVAQGDQTAVGGVAAAQVFLAQSLGDGKRLIEKSHQALSLLPADDLTQRGNVALGLGIAYWHIGQLNAAQQALEEALQDCQGSDNFYGEISSRVFLARTLAVRGYLRQAFPELEALVQPAEKLPILPLIYLDLGTLYYEWDNLEAGSRYFSQALESSQRIGNLEFQMVSLMLHALLILAQGDSKAALHTLERAGQIAQSRDVPARTQTRFIDLRLQFALRLNDFETAQQLASQLSGEGDCHPFYRFLGLTEARLLLATGQRHTAAEQLATAVETARTNDWGYGLVAALALQAVAQEDASAGLECLQQALSLAQSQGYLRTFADIGEPLVSLLQEAARRNLMPAYIGQIISAMKGKTQLAFGSEKLVEPLSVREVEVLRLLVAGFSNREIAEKLVLSLGTVKTHIHNIYGKLEVRSRAQAIQRATELELL